MGLMQMHIAYVYPARRDPVRLQTELLANGGLTAKVDGKSVTLKQGVHVFASAAAKVAAVGLT